MKSSIFASAVFLFLLIATCAIAPDAYAQDGVSIFSSESETVSAATGKSISVKSVCPSGKRVIGGGGECYGYLNTQGRAALTRNAPLPDESAWLVECANMNPAPGQIQARAWAICADPGVLEK